MPDSSTPVLTVDIGAILANYRLLRDRVAPGLCGAAVKADAYGLGAAQIAPHLEAAGCAHFFVATVDEGLALRRMLPVDRIPGARIYVLSGLPAGAEGDVAGGDLIPVLNSLPEIERWRAFALATAPRPAALQFDTGLSRLGLRPEDAKHLAGDPHLLDGIEIGLIMTHLACADDPGHPLNQAQLTRFRDIAGHLKLAPHQGSKRPLLSLAGSSGIFLGSDYHFDLARPGAALYGVNPVPGAQNPLRPVLRLQAKILQLREVDLNMTVGYGASHQFRGPSVLATIGVGYADGILRSLGNRGAVFVTGQRAPIVGRISMDLVTIDVGHLPRGACQPGMAVDLIGPEQSVDDLARDAGTIGYEILTNLGARFERRYTGAPA